MVITHFKAEDRHGDLVTEGCVESHIQTESGFTHGRSTGDNYEVCLLKTARQFVQSLEAGQDTGSLTPLPLIHQIEDLFERFLHGVNVFSISPLGESKYFSSGFVDQVGGILLANTSPLFDFMADIDNIPASGSLFDNVGIFESVTTGANPFGKLLDVFSSSRLLQLLFFFKEINKEDSFDDSLIRKQLQDVTEDRLVPAKVEVFGFELFNRHSADIAAIEQSSQQGFLCFAVVRQRGLGHIFCHHRSPLQTRDSYTESGSRRVISRLFRRVHP